MARGFQKHHLIPVQIFRKPAFGKLFEYAKIGGFDPRDFRTNGVYLPASERLAAQCERPLHRGPHPRYNELVATRLFKLENSIRQSCGKIGYKSNPRDIALRLYKVQKTLRGTLLSNPCPIILNKRDPMSRHINFTYLDDDVDRLWSAIST